jgi:hypothetical protein
MNRKVTTILSDEERLFIENVRKKTKREVKEKKKTGPKYVDWAVGWKFTKMFDGSQELLLELLSPQEYKVVGKMIFMAQQNTNSLKPLREDMSLRTLGSEFGVCDKTIKNVLEKLYNLGIYGKFEVSAWDKATDMCEYRKYWVLNPWVAFKGQKMIEGLYGMFVETIFTKLVIENVKFEDSLDDDDEEANLL